MPRAAARVVAATLLAVPAVQAAQAAPAAPCDSAAHHAFDFWLGSWQVHAASGQLAGSSRIERQYGGCVLHEHYDTARGYSGESLNIYDAARDRWHQTWVDNSGLLLVLEGGLHDGAMRLEGRTQAADGNITQHRITWTPRPDGSVRQHWESTDAQGAWQTAFDGIYTRRSDAASAPSR